MLSKPLINPLIVRARDDDDDVECSALRQVRDDITISDVPSTWEVQMCRGGFPLPSSTSN